MADESKGKFDWVPLTPAKSVPARYEFNSKGKLMVCEFGDNIEKFDSENCGARKVTSMVSENPGSRSNGKPEGIMVVKSDKRVPQGNRMAGASLLSDLENRTLMEVSKTPQSRNLRKRPTTKMPSTTNSSQRPKLEKNSFTETSVQPTKVLKVCDKIGGCNQSELQNSVSSRFGRVYTRILKPNQCLKNSRKLGPVFPSIFKKARMNRRRAIVFDMFFRLGNMKPHGRTNFILKLNSAVRRKRSTKRKRRDLSSLSSFVRDLSELQLSEIFLWIASSIRTKIAARVEVNVVSCNDHIQHSEKKESIELCPDDVVIQISSKDFEDHTDGIEPITNINPFDEEAEGDREADVLSSQDYDVYTRALVDFSIEMMEGLHIDGVSKVIVLRNAFIRNSDTPNKRQPRPKFDKAKYCDGQLDKFISAIHFIQEKKPLSWKGSVVDSVICGFLTQNVSDYLPSEVFMNLASRFPAVTDSANHDLKLLITVEELSDEVELEQRSMVKKGYDTEDGNVNLFPSKSLSGEKNEDKPDTRHWDEVRVKYSTPNNRTNCNRDSVNWDAVRQTSFHNLTVVMLKRSTNYIPAGVIKDLLERLVRDHGSIDLEWLRDVPPHISREYLLSISGLGEKSVEFVMLLSLQHQDLPV